MQLATMKIKNQAGHAMIVNVSDFGEWKAKGYVEDVPVPESPQTDGDGEKAQAKGTDPKNEPQAKGTGPKNEPQPKGQAKQK